MSMQDKHILIAEDDVFLADILSRSLRDHGVRVTVARDGREAIAAIEHEQPSLLLLDLLMPDIDGYGVLEHVRGKNLAFPVVVLSNLSDSRSGDRCRELGVQGYFVKSDLDEDRLWPVVTAALGVQ